MNLLIYPVPLFDENIAVKAYYLKNRRGNEILEGGGSAAYDGAMLSLPLAMLNVVGLEALTMNRPIFIPVNRYMLLSRLEIQSAQPADKLFFLINGNEISEANHYIENMIRLRKLGFGFALQMINNFERIRPLLPYCSYVFFDARVSGDAIEEEIRERITDEFTDLKVVYVNIESHEEFDILKNNKGSLFQGPFYSLPLTKGKQDVEPFQANLINLVNMVNRPEIDFEEVSQIVAEDPAMAVSLLRMVNSVHFALKERIKSINQAVVMVGQKEICKWVTAIATKQLGAEKPSELTRLALIRAKFAEEMGIKFGYKQHSDSIFLVGLFSVLGAMLDMPMDEALKLVNVTSDIYDALVTKTGKFGFIHHFIIEYEAAHWSFISRMMILHNIKADDVYEAYLNSMLWYHSIITEI